MKKQSLTLFKRTVQQASSAGFTLVELMVVVALVAVVSAIAIPNFQNMIVRNNIASQMNEFIATLHLARTTAIQRGKYVTICRITNDALAAPVCDATSFTSAGGVMRYSSDWATGWMVFVEADPTGSPYVFDAGDVLIRRFESRTDGYAIFSNKTAQHITFNPQGLLSGSDSNGLRFGFSNLTASNDTQKSVCVTRGGSIRTVSANGGNACTDY